jgi:tetratricopeptide (TPR) repeat protein
LFRATLGRLLTAVGAYDQAEALLEEAAEDDAANGSMLFVLADLRIHQTRFQEAEALLRELLARSGGGSLPDRATLHHLLASVFFEQDRFAEAETEARRALLLVDSGSPPELPGEIRSTLAAALICQGGWSEGLALQRQAVEVLTRSVGADHLSTLQTRRSLAGFLYAAKQYEEARRELEDLVGLYEKVLGPKHTYLAGALNTLGDTYRALGRLELAERYQRRGLAIRREVLGGDHKDLTLSLNSLAGVLMDKGAPDEAIGLYREALAISRRGGQASLHRVTQASHLGQALALRGRREDLEEAETLLTEAYERLLRDPAFGAESPYTARTRRELEAFRKAHGAPGELRARRPPRPPLSP